MVDYLPRSAWGARPPEPGPGLLTVSRVVGTAVHWPGTTSSTPIAKDRVDDALRGWQNYHMDDRGWSDIAYQVAVDQWGRAWTLRGIRTQSGANGSTEVNEDYGAVLLVLVQDEEPTEAMKATVRAVMADYRAIFPNWRDVVGHFQIRPEGTDCPGPAAKRALAAGEFNPTIEENEMQFTDPIPGLFDPDGSPVTVGEALARGVWAYRQGPIEGSATDNRLDNHETRLKALETS